MLVWSGLSDWTGNPFSTQQAKISQGSCYWLLSPVEGWKIFTHDSEHGCFCLSPPSQRRSPPQYRGKECKVTCKPVTHWDSNRAVQAQAPALLISLGDSEFESLLQLECRCGRKRPLSPALMYLLSYRKQEAELPYLSYLLWWHEEPQARQEGPWWQLPLCGDKELWPGKEKKRILVKRWKPSPIRATALTPGWAPAADSSS